MVMRYEAELHEYLDKNHKDYMKKLTDAGSFNENLKKELIEILQAFKGVFKPR